MHDSPDAPLVTLRWYGTDLPFLDGESVINSRDWDSDQWVPLRVGEEPFWNSTRTYNGQWEKPTDARGGHLCHADWFATGEPWPVTLPNTVYTSQHIPRCCCVDSYLIHADDEVTTANVLVPAFACRRWDGVGPGTGKPWRIFAPPVLSQPFWVVQRRRNGLPTFYTYFCTEAWDGRGTSPPFQVDPALDPGAPGERITVTEVV